MRRIGIGSLIVFVLAAALALSACGGGAPTPTGEAEESKAGFPVTVTDDASREVTIETAPRRIVSLAPANTEIVHSLGIFDRLVGVTTYDDYPVDVERIAKMGDFTTPNLEAIADAEPDLVLVTGGVQADVIEKLEGLDAKVLVVDPQDIEGVEAAVEMVAKACGVPEAAVEVNERIEDKLGLVREAIGDAEPVSCFVEIGYDPLFTAGEGTLLDDLVRAGGGRNVVQEKGYVSYSVEQLLADQPTCYLGTSASLGDAKTISARPGYSRLDAVTSGRVAVLEDDWVSRPGPRIADGVEQIARALHPDRF